MLGIEGRGIPPKASNAIISRLVTNKMWLWASEYRYSFEWIWWSGWAWYAKVLRLHKAVSSWAKRDRGSHHPFFFSPLSFSRKQRIDGSELLLKSLGRSRRFAESKLLACSVPHSRPRLYISLILFLDDKHCVLYGYWYSIYQFRGLVYCHKDVISWS